MADGSGFFRELKRRHVWRVAAAYLVAGWLLIQITTQIFPVFDVPAWGVRLVVILTAIGFPVAVIGAWIYEVTPAGIRRTEPAGSPDARAEGDARLVGRKLDVLIIAVLAIAVALLGWRVLVLQRAPARAVAQTSAATRSPDDVKRNPATTLPDSAAGAAASGLPNAVSVSPLSTTTTAAIPQNSVAVLPFTNESGDPDQRFFSDGLSEDLINALSQLGGLKVISRHSAFQFRDSKDSSKAIGDKLGVAQLLEGTVQHAAGKVRITATLVNAADGSTLWSQQYDKPYRDLFALQDAITRDVATALQAKLLTTPGAVVQSDRPPGGSLDAYVAYQRGIAYAALATNAGTRQAVAAFGAAIRLDPRYAAAYAQLSRAWTHLGASGVEPAHARDAARRAMLTALKLDPDSSLAHQARGYWLANAVMDWKSAEAEYQRALQLSPSDVEAQFGLGRVVAALGQNERAIELSRRALVSDPRRAEFYILLGASLDALGKLDEARGAINTAIMQRPGAAGVHVLLVITEILRGDAAAAMVAAQQEPPGVWHAVALALAAQPGADRQLADHALATLVREHADISPYQIAEVYALRHDSDAMFNWLERARTGRDAGLGLLLSDPFILRYRDDPRFAAFCRKVGLPASTDAVAMRL